MTTTVEHTITVTESNVAGRDWRDVTCSCGYTTIAFDAERYGARHLQNPTAARAHEFMKRLQEGNLTEAEQHGLAVALAHAATAADGILPATSRDLAADGLIKLVRGEA